MRSGVGADKYQLSVLEIDGITSPCSADYVGFSRVPPFKSRENSPDEPSDEALRLFCYKHRAPSTPDPVTRNNMNTVIDSLVMHSNEHLY